MPTVSRKSYRPLWILLAVAVLIAASLDIGTSFGQAAPKPHSHARHHGERRRGHRHHTVIGLREARRVSPRVKRCAALARKSTVRARLAGCPKKLSTTSALTAPSSLYWGAWIGEQFTGAQAPWDMNAVSDFEKVAQKPLSLVNFSSPFANCEKAPCSYYAFPKEPMENVRQHGAIPFFSWASQSTPSSLDEPEFQLADVIEGKYDNYIREWATAAAAWGHPFFLRFNWEMNGNWFPWSEGVNGNNPGEYVAAWRHVHDIFTEVGATNATWTWCPNVDPGHSLHELASLYPGDEYVDWTCLDGYNWGSDPAHPAKWHTFDELFSTTYHEITETIAPTKPMVIGEVGSTEEGGSKAQWIEEMLRDVPTEYPQIHGLQWFDKEEEGDWPIESSSSSAAAFAAGIQSPSYLGNEFAAAGSGPIAAPVG